MCKILKKYVEHRSYKCMCNMLGSSTGVGPLIAIRSCHAYACVLVYRTQLPGFCYLVYRSSVSGCKPAWRVTLYADFYSHFVAVDVRARIVVLFHNHTVVFHTCDDCFLNTL
jgi:hypothetical protein